MPSRSNNMVTRYGPVVAGDARLHIATDEYGCLATQQTAAARQLKEYLLAHEQSPLRQWIQYFCNARKQ